MEEISALEIEHGEEAAWSNGAERTEASAATEPAAPAAPPPVLPTLDISSYAAVVAIAPAPMQVPSDWVQMNGSAPLQGSETQVINRADLSNRYFAALDPQDELSGEYLALNAKAGACVVFVASEEQVRTMALNTAPVHQLPSLLALSVEEQKIALEPYISRLAGRSYAELAKLAAMPIPEVTPAPTPTEPQPVEAATIASDNPAPALPKPATLPVTQVPEPNAELARRVVSKADAMKVMTYFKPFMSAQQRNAVKQFMQGEEKQFFYDKMVELADIIRNMPHTYQQRNEDQPTYYLHYFKGGADWHIAEKDKLGDGTLQAFGHADLFGDGGELGYINIDELVANGVELDLHFEPQKLAAKAAEEVSAPPKQTGTQGQDGARVADAQFLRDVASGKIDIWQNDPSARLDAMFASYDESDTEMMTLCLAAVTAYTDFMKAMMRKLI